MPAASIDSSSNERSPPLGVRPSPSTTTTYTARTSAVSPASATVCVSSRSTRATAFGNVPAITDNGTRPVIASAAAPGESGQSLSKRSAITTNTASAVTVSPQPIHWIRRRSSAPACRYRWWQVATPIAERRDPEQDGRPGGDGVEVEAQRATGQQRNRVAGDDAASTWCRPQPAVGQRRQNMERDRREQAHQQSHRDRCGVVPFLEIVTDTDRLREAQPTTQNGGGEHDRAQTIVTPAHAE